MVRKRISFASIPLFCDKNTGKKGSPIVAAKKVFLSSLVMIAVPSVLFFCLYLLIWHGAKNDRTDYSGDVLGIWTGVQYYQGGQKTVCVDSASVTVTFTPDTVAIESGAFPLDSTAYTWRGRSLVFTADGTEVVTAVSFDSQNYLKLSIPSWDLTLTLRPATAEGQ